MRRPGFLASTSLGFILLHGAPATAACIFSPTAGDDVFICDSGTAPGLDGLGGNDTLTLPSGGTGVIAGAVIFGGGVDLVRIESGTIEGNMQQGAGIDDFQMTGGVLQSLNQGDSLDTFFMSGGRIIDYFEDGDQAVMTGGRIGRVNMKLDNNLFDMSGGIIDGNLVTGFGNDTIILSSGTIGGNVSVSGGSDSVTVTGGTIGGNVSLSFGTDVFVWDGGGIIYGEIRHGDGDDTATLANLTNSNLGATPIISGGPATDRLTLDNVSMGNVSRLQNWETIDATNDTELTFGGDLVLGDVGTGTGALTVDSTSTLFGGGGNASIRAFAAGQLASVVNAGRIDLTNGGGGAGNIFTISGNYTGDDGLLFLNTVLGNDASASDRLVIGGGSATGTTYIEIVNAGGAGALTTGNGILVVEAVNGGTTAAGAFALGGRVAAGAYEYLLFRGGTSAGVGNNWYLRSTAAPAPAPGPSPTRPNPEPEPEEPEASAPPPPSAIPPVPEPTDGDATTDPVDPTPPVDASDPAPVAPPAPPPAGEPDPPPPFEEIALEQNPMGELPRPNPDRIENGVVPLYRAEVPTDMVVASLARHLALSTLGTFHERRGEQAFVEGAGYLPAAWGRVFGQDTELSWTGTLTPSFDGTLFGIQAGLDLAGWEWGSGQQDRLGLFVAHTRMSGDVESPTLAGTDAVFGDVDIDATSFGATWTHLGPSGWYLDGVAMVTWFGGDATSSAGERIDIDGSGVTLSLESGYPFQIAPNWTLEPQAQLVWRHVSLDDAADSFSSVSFDSDDGLTGRIGLRLQGSFQTAAFMSLQPYLKANIWEDFDGEDRVLFDSTPIVTETGGTAFEIGGGVVASISETTRLFATADYTTNLGGEDRQILEGNIGLSVKW